MKDKTVVIIPAYNEEKNIAGVIKEIKKAVPDVYILVINDGGQDRTEEIVRLLGERVVNLPYNMGYGAALQAGFKYALKHGYEYAVQIDADGQHDPKDIPKLLKVVLDGEADVAMGSRFLDGGRYKAPLIRKAGMLIFAWLASVIIGQKITDPTSGYQALNSSAIRFYASDYYPTDFPDADVIIMLHRAGLTIKEIPVTMYPNPQKSMHAGLKPVYYIFKMFLSIFLTLLRKDPFQGES
ncbi:MAG: glycosyltransferase family 2 protein [Deltaproteobacteria bacterium]|nr:glycosyltransferase family 2 protein [Deltaproteobacteria bacterium]MBW2075272.1 glycosyltransferase family 2 protein [Deltaproteobacteria bacterium]RLB81591.1 MAG: glycosyltransferase family 2 protein [Deltaproteobacteria bacterium]